MSLLYRSWLAIQGRILGFVAGVTLFAGTLLAIVEIFRRYVLGQTFFWA